jgi:GDP/UDP-N,N'-diacetylbacillosamine 2-epimerase (hydrolysing)
MKIGVLTSSRADFSAYQPLLRTLFADSFFQTEIIAFGTHLSVLHGHTIDEILKNNFPVKHRINTVPKSDTPFAISTSVGETMKLFAEFWNSEKFDLVFAFGDRYEMFAAVAAGSPFNVKFAHLHAGETTLGAIDNSYRHSISLMSEYLFVSAEEYKKRAIEIIQKPENVFNVGSLSTDNLKNTELFSIEEFRDQFNIDLRKPTILTTFHPETVSPEKNELYISELLSSLDELKNKYQIVITLPNSDTMGLMVRDKIGKFAANKKNIILVESFGMKGYLSCINHCSFMIGNSSSGFGEACFFPKYVINVGDRQKGRIITPNIYSIPVSKEMILKTVKIIEKLPPQQSISIYGDGNTAGRIVSILKNKNS